MGKGICFLCSGDKHMWPTIIIVIRVAWLISLQVINMWLIVPRVFSNILWRCQRSNHRVDLYL